MNSSNHSYYGSVEKKAIRESKLANILAFINGLPKGAPVNITTLCGIKPWLECEIFRNSPNFERNVRIIACEKDYSRFLSLLNYESNLFRYTRWHLGLNEETTKFEGFRQTYSQANYPNGTHIRFDALRTEMGKWQEMDVVDYDSCGNFKRSDAELAEHYLKSAALSFFTFDIHCVRNLLPRNIPESMSKDDLLNSEKIVAYLEQRTGARCFDKIVYKNESENSMAHKMVFLAFENPNYQAREEEEESGQVTVTETITVEQPKKENIEMKANNTTNNALQTEFKAFIIKQLNKGYKSTELAKEFNLPIGRVRAWQAWETMRAK